MTAIGSKTTKIIIALFVIAIALVGLYFYAGSTISKTQHKINVASLWISKYMGNPLQVNGNSLIINNNNVIIFGNTPIKLSKVAFEFLLKVNRTNGKIVNKRFFHTNKTVVFSGSGCKLQDEYIFVSSGVMGVNKLGLVVNILSPELEDKKAMLLESDKSISFRSISCIGDKAYIAGKYDDGAIIIAIDKNGNILWSNEYTTNTRIVPTDILATNKGIYLVWVSLNNKIHSGVIKLDTDGKIVWSKQYSTSEPSAISDCTSGSNIVCTGLMGTDGSYRPIIIQLSATDGSIIDAKYYTGFQSATGKFVKLVDGQVMLFGEKFSPNGHPITPFVLDTSSEPKIATVYDVNTKQGDTGRLVGAGITSNTLFLLFQAWNANSKDVWTTLIKTDLSGEIPNSTYMSTYPVYQNNLDLNATKLTATTNTISIHKYDVETTNLRNSVQQTYIQKP